MLKLTRKGQSTAEYAIVIGLVIAAAVGMQVYVKRGLQSKVKGAVDYSPDDMFKTGQYEPYYSASDMNVKQTSEYTESTSGGAGRRKDIASEVTNRTGTQTTIGL